MFDEYLLLEKMYFYELERKQQLEKSPTVPIGVIVASFGLVGYFTMHFQFGGHQYILANVVEYVFEIAAVASFVLLVIAAYWCNRTVTGSAYEYLPGAETMRQYRQDLERWHRKNTSRNPMENAASEFREYIASSLARCSQGNWQVNLVRSEELFRAKQYTGFALAVLALNSLTFIVDFLLDGPNLAAQ